MAPTQQPHSTVPGRFRLPDIFRPWFDLDEPARRRSPWR
jgi:hypothetical protein